VIPYRNEESAAQCPILQASLEAKAVEAYTGALGRMIGQSQPIKEVNRLNPTIPRHFMATAVN